MYVLLYLFTVYYKNRPTMCSFVKNLNQIKEEEAEMCNNS